MFEIKVAYERVVYISDVGSRYLHSDGHVFSTVEYFPTRKRAQAVLDKFYPKPEHVWEHGDVFDNSVGRWIYLEPAASPMVISLDYPKDDATQGSTPSIQLNDAKFLFNIKEKI